MQFKIPQDVQREDHIVGPLTLKQLIICGVGGAIGYSIYITLGKQYFMEIWLPPVIFVAGITIAFAFVKIHNLSFFKYLLMLILHFFLPRQKKWQKQTGDIFISAFAPEIKTKKNNFENIGKTSRKPTSADIENLSKLIDSHT
ncbi:PrgI family protein [Candidatus Peregrinibacteria bacterium]|nr:PrgI family protein [Candidatus Peregrinibacteria bacterium]